MSARLRRMRHNTPNNRLQVLVLFLAKILLERLNARVGRHVRLKRQIRSGRQNKRLLHQQLNRANIRLAQHIVQVKHDKLVSLLLTPNLIDLNDLRVGSHARLVGRAPHLDEVKHMVAHLQRIPLILQMEADREGLIKPDLPLVLLRNIRIRLVQRRPIQITHTRQGAQVLQVQILAVQALHDLTLQRQLLLIQRLLEDKQLLDVIAVVRLNRAILLQAPLIQNLIWFICF